MRCLVSFLMLFMISFIVVVECFVSVGGLVGCSLVVVVFCLG